MRDRDVLQQHEAPGSVGRAIACRTTDFTYVYRLYEGDELYDRRADPHETITSPPAPSTPTP